GPSSAATCSRAWANRRPSCTTPISSSRRSTRRTCSARPRSRPRRRRPSAGWPTSSLVRSPSCTGPPTPETAARRSSISPTPTTSASRRTSTSPAPERSDMKQELTTDTVDRYIEASPEALYDLIADVTRTPERTPDIVRCEWLVGATGPAVGARFKSTNRQGRGPNWSNKPVVTVADPGVEFSFTRTEPFAGTILWRHRFVAEGTGTRL